MFLQKTIKENDFNGTQPNLHATTENFPSQAPISAFFVVR